MLIKILGIVILSTLAAAFFGGLFGLLYLVVAGEFDKAEGAGVIDMDGSATELLKKERRNEN